MFSTLFYKLLSMSLIACVIAALTLLIRRRFDKTISPLWKLLVWLPVLLVLLVPYRFHSDWSPIKREMQIERTISELVSNMATPERFRESGKNEALPGRAGDSAVEARPLKRGPAFEEEAESVANKSSLARFFSRENLVNEGIPIIWLAGLLLLSLHFVRSRRKLSALAKVPAGEEEDAERLHISGILDACREHFGIDEAVSFCIGKDFASPAIMGIFRPVILLPEYVKSMSDESISYILYHELAHYKRKDLLLNQLLLCLQILYWFNPLLLPVFKWIRDDMEVLTDEYVLKRIGEEKSKSYSRSLVEVLANANRIPFLPRTLCMAGDGKNIERRIQMIKLREEFKKRRIWVSVLCVALIAGIAIFALTGKTGTHKIAFYALEGIDLKESEYLEAIKQVEPVLTEQDIAAYNKESKMIFLKEEALKAYEKILLSEEQEGHSRILDGGSIFLGVKGPAYTFVITVDEKPVLHGTIQRPVAVSHIPAGYHITDARGGLRLFTPFPIRDEAEKQQAEKALSRFETSLEDMGLTTDKLFDFRRGKAIYKTSELYSYRTEYAGDNSKVSGIINHLVFPEGVAYKQFSLGTEKEPYSVTVHLERSKREAGMEAHYQANREIYDTDAQLLLALVGNLEIVNFVFEGEGSPYTLTYHAAAISRETLEEGTEIAGALLVKVEKYYEEASTAIKFYKLFSDEFFGPEFVENDGSKEDAGSGITKDAKESGKEERVYPKDTDVQVKNILKRISENPKASSAPKAYIDAHPKEYYELLKLLSQDHLKKEIASLQLKGLDAKILEQAISELKEEPLFFYTTETDLRVHTDGSEKRALNERELHDVTRALQVLRYDASLDEERVNPLSYLTYCSFESPEKIDLSELVTYMRNRSLKDDAVGVDKRSEQYQDSDTEKFETLKTLQDFPFRSAKTLAELPVPVHEVFEEDVDMLLLNYLGIDLEKMDGIGKEKALYIEKYGSFFTYNSDFGLADFIAESGEIDGMLVYLYSETSKLTIKADEKRGHWYIVSHTKR
ncbi:MAG: M56 family metallopeptidase [Bacillota bacterium]|nr:M56 family metallopeptidase [Bacillota bacterium]